MLPIIFSSTYFVLYSYPLFMGLAWGASYYITQYLFHKQNENDLPLLNLYIGIFFSSWLGAKIFFLIFSAQNKFTEYLHADYFWLGGGFVFYGGLIFGILFYLIYSFWLKKFNRKNTYLLIPGLAMGHAIGRVGCFLTGCCYGVQCKLPWAINTRHPVQLYEAFALFLLGLLTLDWVKKQKPNMYIAVNYLIIYSLIRFFIEFFRGDKMRGLFWLTLSTSQLISVVLLTIGTILKLKKENQ